MPAERPSFAPTRRQVITMAGAVVGAAAVGSLATADPAAAAVVWNYPFRSRHAISSGFGPRPSPGNGGSTNHQGIDYAAAAGTAICAVAAGTVIFVGGSGGYGNLTKIQHADGYVSWYAHQSAFAIANGARVTGGQYIGRVGSTGNHLHLGVTRNDVFINPSPFIDNAPLAGDTKAPSAPRDEFTLISSPARGAAVIGPGYYRALPTAEFVACAVALIGDPVVGNDRQFDVWKSIALTGTAA